MAITTLAGVQAGLQAPVYFNKTLSSGGASGRPWSTFFYYGFPAAAAAPTPGLAGAALTSYKNQIPFTNPTSGNTYLGRLQISANVGGTVLLCDRLWHNSGITITSTSAQTINSVTWPARDSNGATSGEDVLIGVEVSTATGAGTPTLSMTYTNSAGTGSRTATNVIATVATTAIGGFYPLGLAAGDVGVQSIQDFTLSATWTSGTIHLVAYRVIAAIEIPTAASSASIDALTSGFPQMFDNTVPFFVVIPSQSATPQISGQLIYTQG